MLICCGGVDCGLFDGVCFDVGDWYGVYVGGLVCGFGVGGGDGVCGGVVVVWCVVVGIGVDLVWCLDVFDLFDLYVVFCFC